PEDASDARDVEVALADTDGVFPEGFYATTNFPTDVRVDGVWSRVSGVEMDVGVRVVRAGAGVAPRAEACPMHRVRKG
ncbi:TIGR00300 family protein, partial [Salmonella enterica subsp. enterica serovar Enteritidis]|uniref:hypothetical protein n=1 Tax=Salmonella enterica TaxID=28901 RepID=UPI0018C88F7E